MGVGEPGASGAWGAGAGPGGTSVSIMMKGFLLLRDEDICCNGAANEMIIANVRVFIRCMREMVS